MTNAFADKVIPLYPQPSDERSAGQLPETPVEAVITERTEERREPRGRYLSFTETTLKLFGKPNQISEILGPWLPYLRGKSKQAALGSYGAIFGSTTSEKMLPGISVNKPASIASSPRTSPGVRGKQAQCSVLIEGVDEPLSLDDTLAIATNWEAVNNRRVQLIEKKAAKQISREESAELQHLQRLAWAKRQMVMPLPLKQLAGIEEALRRMQLWQDE